MTPDPGCAATRHGMWATRHGCHCPTAVAAIREYRRIRARRVYLPGRRSHNLSSPRSGFDAVAVQRAADGDRSLVLSLPERTAAIGLLARRERLTATQIAVRLGITTRTVDRHLARLRATTSPSTTPKESA